MDDIVLVSGNGNMELSKKIASDLGVELFPANVKQFSDGEINVSIEKSVRGKDAFIIQSTCPPVNDNLMELLIITDALKRSSAKSVQAIVPYFGYARQDRKAAPRVPITAKLVADIIETAGVDRVISMDLHAGQIQGFFSIPADNLYGAVLFVDYIKANMDTANLVIASPDIGGISRARYFADRLHLDLVIIDKKREKANQSEAMNVIGDVQGKDVILVDDIIDTAGTICHASDILKAHGAKKVTAFGTHGLFSGKALSNIENSSIEKMYITNTIGNKEEGKVKIIDASHLFAKVIRKLRTSDSINALFEN